MVKKILQIIENLIQNGTDFLNAKRRKIQINKIRVNNEINFK